MEKMYRSVSMQKKLALKSGAILVSESDTRRQELSKMADVSYNIYCKGRKLFSNLTEEEYFDMMEDLSIEYYQTGSPRPEDLETEIIRRLTNGNA